MTRINIDNNVSEIPLSEDRILGDVIDEVMVHLPENRVLTGISIDGKHISSADKVSYFQEPLGQTQELTIRTTDKAIWTSNGLDMALSCLQSTQRSLIVVAELYRDGNVAEGNHFFAHCVEGLERYTETMILTRTALKLDFTRISYEERSLSQMEEQLSEILKGILKFQQINDYVGIADRIEYELIPALGHWVAALNHLRRVYCSNA